MRPTRALPTLAAAMLVAGVALIAVACASTTRFDGPGGDRRLYRARCGLCHVPFAPGDFHPDDWPDLVAEMGPRAGLGAAYRERILNYLVTESEGAWARR